ncbi:MAG: sigma-70 family RNA polymerase sigma factor [Eubacterium sp.]|nr:sigma-70 family RNA polymerase sigma factor [Eubacterium sp.]MDE6155161.1 sigma-70 family RNA polymerase sigma factor [Eubacterium sp.]MDE6767101.1 sigma-70 family RNA polymerase sigma factor [Eubacterium sp.]
MSKKSSANEESIIRKYSSTVYKIAYSITSNKADSEDIYQNVFLRYIRKKPEFNDDKHAKAWFIRVTLNCAKSFLTQAWNKNTEPLNEEIEYNHREKPDLDFALKQLTPNCRTIIYLYYYEGYSTNEIASMLDMKNNAVRTSLSRSRDRLKTILEKEGYNA